jgi:CheY-like chemotaxis protein
VKSILVIEDDENKRAQLCKLIAEILAEVEVRTAKSLQSGIREVRLRTPTLVLLDMTLPNFDPTAEDPGGQTHSFGGREFLRQLDRFDIRVPVIVVTQFIKIGKGNQAVDFSDLDAQLRAEYSPNYVGAVYYHAGIRGWKQELSKLIKGQMPAC